MNHTHDTSAYLKKYGLALIRKGYSIVPIKPGYKFPKGLNNWQAIYADERLLLEWLAGPFKFAGIGILTKHTPAIDIDVRDAQIIEKLLKYIKKKIGISAQRVGEAPKLLLPYRTDRPFNKISSPIYQDQAGKKHQIEIMGDGQQFVAYGIHPKTQRPYTWISEQALADIQRDDLITLTQIQAQQLIEYFSSIVPPTWPCTSDHNRLQESTPHNTLTASINALPIVVDNIQDKLNHVNAEDYSTWIKVGMALHHQHQGNAEGFDLWNEWSSKSNKYNAEEMQRKWASFKLNNPHPVTAASIVSMTQLPHAETDRQLLGEFLERYVYIEDGDRICDLHKPAFCSISKFCEFKNVTANCIHAIPTPTHRNPEKTRAEMVWRTWLAHPERKTAQSTCYRPGEERIIQDEYGLNWINEFYFPVFEHTTNEDRLDVFFNHTRYLFPIASEHEWFIDWMAFNLQHPKRRCKVTPLHISVAHGTGRGWLVKLMMQLLGSWNCTKTKMVFLCGENNNFHDYLNNSLFCAIEEVKEGDKRYAISDSIRDLLTEDDLEINIKFGTKNTQPVYTNFFFMSNHPDALVLTKEDRRINVFMGPDTPKDNDYYHKLYQWLETPGITQLYNHLMRRNLSQFNWQRSINNDAKMSMINNNRTQTEVLFWDLMEAPRSPVMTFAQIKHQMRHSAECEAFEVQLDDKQLLKLLQRHCKQGIPVKVRGKRMRPWLLCRGQELDHFKMREYLGYEEDAIM